ncbi:elongation factor tu gtp binding domain-containing protein, partial [Cystoisospora suis]
ISPHFIRRKLLALHSNLPQTSISPRARNSSLIDSQSSLERLSFSSLEEILHIGEHVFVTPLPTGFESSYATQHVSSRNLLREVALLDDPSEIHSSSFLLNRYLHSSPSPTQQSSFSSSAVRTADSLHSSQSTKDEEEDDEEEEEDVSHTSIVRDKVCRTRTRSFSSSSSSSFSSPPIIYPRATPGLQVDAVAIKVEEGYALFKLFCSPSSSSPSSSLSEGLQDGEADGVNEEEDSSMGEGEPRQGHSDEKKSRAVSRTPVSSPSWGFLHWSAVDFSSSRERKGESGEREGIEDEISLDQDEDVEISPRKRHGRIDLRQ